MTQLIRLISYSKKAKNISSFPVTFRDIFCELKVPATLGEFDMRLSYEESSRPSFSWSFARLPQIRIAVPSLLDDTKRRKNASKAKSNAHKELLDQFRSDMDGFMPQRVSRKKLARRA